MTRQSQRDVVYTYLNEPLTKFLSKEKKIKCDCFHRTRTIFSVFCQTAKEIYVTGRGGLH